MDLRKKIFSDISRNNRKQFYLIIIVPILLFIAYHNFPGFFLNSPRFKPSGINSKFDFDTSKPFSDYINYSREIIIEGRTDLELNPHLDGKTILEWNSPFILEPDPVRCGDVNKGFLLIHGLSDSPFTLRELGEHLRDQCFLVYSILLTGDGTRPADLLDVSYKDWIAQTEYGIKELSNRVDNIYIAGYSTGGLLAMNYTLDNDNVKGLILFVPSLELPKIVNLAPAFKHIFKWFWIHDDNDVIKYESFTSNGAEQVRLLANLVKSKLTKDDANLKNAKVFAIFSYEDVTIKPIESIKLLLDHTNPKDRNVIVYHQEKDSITGKITREDNVFPINATSITRDRKIIGMSHLSLSLEPGNIWAGENGSYRDCLHYFKVGSNYKKCAHSNNTVFGEITVSNLDDYDVVTRATYNPFILDLYKSMDQFLAN